MEGKVRIGKVSRLHGYKGEVSLKVDSGFKELFSGLDYIFLSIKRKPVPFFIESLRFTPQGYALVFFEGVDSQSEAEKIRGSEIWIEENAIPKNESEQKELRAFIGYNVDDALLGRIGEVDEIVEHPGNTFLVINREDGQVLIPAHEEILKSVDHEQMIIHIAAPDGLIELNLN